jgi:hypothetical protein
VPFIVHLPFNKHIHSTVDARMDERIPKEPKQREHPNGGIVLGTLTDLDIILTAAGQSRRHKGNVIFRSLADWTAPLFKASMNFNEIKWRIARQLCNFILNDAGMRFVGHDGKEGHFREVPAIMATRRVMNRMVLLVKDETKRRECSLDYVYQDGMVGWRRKLAEIVSAHLAERPTILFKQGAGALPREQKAAPSSSSRNSHKAPASGGAKKSLPKSPPAAPADAGAAPMDDDEDDGVLDFATLVGIADRCARQQAVVEKVTDFDILIPDRAEKGNLIFICLVAATWRMYHEALCPECKAAITTELYQFVKYEAGMCFRVTVGSQYYEASPKLAKEEIKYALHNMREGLVESPEFVKPETLKEWKIKLFDIVLKGLSASISEEAKQMLLQLSAEATEDQCPEAVGTEHVHVTKLDILSPGRAKKAMKALSFHTGNVICRNLIDWTNLMYVEAPTKEVKNAIISKLQKYMSDEAGMRFLVMDKTTNEYVPISAKLVKEKLRTAMVEANYNLPGSPGYDTDSILRWKNGLNYIINVRISQATRKNLYTRKHIDSRKPTAILPIMSEPIMEQDPSSTNQVPLQFREADGREESTGTNRLMGNSSLPRTPSQQ